MKGVIYEGLRVLPAYDGQSGYGFIDFSKLASDTITAVTSAAKTTVQTAAQQTVQQAAQLAAPYVDIISAPAPAPVVSTVSDPYKAAGFADRAAFEKYYRSLGSSTQVSTGKFDDLPAVVDPGYSLPIVSLSIGDVKAWQRFYRENRGWQYLISDGIWGKWSDQAFRENGIPPEYELSKDKILDDIDKIGDKITDFIDETFPSGESDILPVALLVYLLI